MQEHQRRFPVGIVVGLSTLIVTTGGAAAFFTWHSAQNKPAPIAVTPPQATAPLPVPAAPPATTPNVIKSQPKAAATETAQVYWLRDNATDLELVPVPIKVKSDDRQQGLLVAAMNTLLGNAPDRSLMTGIPQGTQLRSLTVKPDGIYVDLSKTFNSGAGSLSMTGRLAQVLYTATSLNPNAKVYLSVEGKPLTVMGGEGLMVEQPLTRSQFEQDTGAKGE